MRRVYYAFSFSFFLLFGIVPLCRRYIGALALVLWFGVWAEFKTNTQLVIHATEGDKCSCMYSRHSNSDSHLRLKSKADFDIGSSRVQAAPGTALSTGVERKNGSVPRSCPSRHQRLVSSVQTVTERHK